MAEDKTGKVDKYSSTYILHQFSKDSMKKANFLLINNHRTDKKEIDFPLIKLKKKSKYY